MTRIIALCLGLTLASAAHAQDMPLYTVLLEGEGWKAAMGTRPTPQPRIEVAKLLTGDGSPLQYDLIFATGERARITGLREAAKPDPQRTTPLGFDEPLSAALSPDGGTLYVGFGKQRAVMTYRLDPKGETSGRDLYCPLRIRKTDAHLAVTGVATDHIGRIFAATADGIHFFDPTGRFSGLIFLPAKGTPEHLTFEGDRLTLWINGTKYERKVNTRGK